MKLVVEEGLWTTDQRVDAPPAVAVLEVCGAVLAWTVDDAGGRAQITFTDAAAADWLWRVLGEAGHVSVVGALADRPARAPGVLDLADVEWVAGALAPLRRLALGHWLRRWWPASVRDGIAELDTALLDAEIAVLTAGAEEFFASDTFDSDIAGLLEPHRVALAAHLRDGDPRVAELLDAAVQLTDWADFTVASDVATVPRRQDYALAAGDAGPRQSGAIASGTSSISWSAVSPGMFDAAEDTVNWSVSAGADGTVHAEIRTAITAPPTGIPVRFDGADGALDAQGRATLTLAISESAAWNRDWSSVSVTVGGTGDPGETPEVRDRIRAFARARLSVPAGDAFLAEVLAAEADY
ncbi:hypothetical protein ACXPWS_13190 [Mycobacterium sp. BMJ-28]